MNISSLTNSITASSAAKVGGLQPQQVTNGDPDSTSGDSGQVHRHHGGGHMHSAIASALKSLGLTMPMSTDASSSSSTSGSSTSSSGSSDGSASSSTGSVKQDMQQFMHQLFEAVKSENGSTPSASVASGSTGSADPQNRFASGLSALIGHVASGTAPAGLQSAFATLTSALQPTGSASSSSSTSTGSGSTSSDQTALQSFLTSLQQNLGYGAAGSSPIGSLLTTMV